jgi:hypothetical protein
MKTNSEVPRERKGLPRGRIVGSDKERLKETNPLEETMRLE